MRQLDPSTFVAPVQLRPEEVAGLAAAGVTLIVNNRPDGEEPGQPAGAEIEAAARAAGIGYRHIPIAGGFNLDDVLAMAEALAEPDGKTLLYCRTGTRSTFLWALARSELGMGREDLVARARAAGYDLGPIAGSLS
ncbi:MAG TPA: TIGR01244 family sulfur transferase [Allosphingosinicella sp.]|jgi:uncharacterized protein (TIGR01244 family)